MMDPTDGLHAFLTARWADEAQHAHNTLEWLGGERWTAIVPEHEWLTHKPGAPLAVRLFVTRQSPQHVIDDLAVKARILEQHPNVNDGDCGTCVEGKWGYPTHGGSSPEHWPCQTLRLLAQPYREHPGYRPEWAPAS